MPPKNERFDYAYFLRLAAALIILAAVYFGSSFFGNKNRETAQNKNQAEQNSEQNENILAASLPISQNAFLVPTHEIIIPIRKWGIEEPQLSAQSAFVIEIKSGKILLQKNADKPRTIASLSKLITAVITIEKANLQDEILISKNAVDTYGEMGSLIEGERISVESLLFALLIESSNDAAAALAEKFNGQFVEFMNQKAGQLGLKNTRFSDASGLDAQNVSTAKDLAKIMNEAIKYPLLNYIMKTAETEISSTDGKYKHKLTNSNKLLEKYPEIIAGKTGYTEEANGCMALVIKAPNGEGMIVNVILGSEDRLSDMDKLIQWEKEAFLW